MTKNKIIALIGIALIIGGFFVGMNYIESKVTTTLDQMLAKEKNVSVESYTFSMPSRELAIKNLAFDVSIPNFMETSYTFEELTIVLPWSLFFYDGEPGVTAVASSIEAKNMISKTTMTSVPGENVATMSLTGYEDLSLEPALLVELLQSENVSETWLKFLQSMTYSSSTVEGFSLIDRNTGILLSLDSILTTDGEGFNAAYLGMEGVKLYSLDAKQTPLLSLETMSMENLLIPEKLIKVAMKLEETDVFPNSALFDEFMSTVLAPELPFMENMQLKNLQLHIPDMPVSLESFDFNWASSFPLELDLTTEKLVFPANLLENEFSFRLPRLETIELSFSTDIETDSDGKRTQKTTLNVKEFGDITADMTFILPKADANAQNHAMPFGMSLRDALLAKAELKYEDKGLLAYVFLNAGIPSSEGVIPLVQLFVRQAAKGAENAQQTEESIVNFIKKPQSLTISLNPEKPMSLSELRQMESNPLQFLKITSTQGDETLDAAMQKLLQE